MKTVKGVKLLLVILVGFALTVGLFGAVGTAPTLAQADTFTESVKVPLDLIIFVPCAAGGAGELVEFSGTLHELLHITFDDAGGFHAMSHFQPQGVSGTGLTTGDKYQGTGVDQRNFNGKVGFESTFVSNFRLIGQGPGNNFLLHGTSHITVHPDGTVTAFVDDFREDCK